MKITLFALALLFTFPLFGQGRKRDVVYLKNGSILRGTIVLQDPGNLIQLRTTDYSLWVFKEDQIDSIKRMPSPSIVLKTGYFNLTEIGVLTGNHTNNNKVPFTLLNVSGWNFKSGFAAGVGVGVDFSNETHFPVVADFRYYLREKRPIPFVSLQAGFSIPLGASQGAIRNAIHNYNLNSNFYPLTNQTVKSLVGFQINPAVGIQFPIQDNLALTLGAGYRWMRYRYSGSNDYRLEVDINRLSLKVGLLFK
ncbi:MAG: hypothetical protein M0R39_04045 [Prolixibacteraceae bacterium]|jgi:hypothetical protein|nr:hypothetical protein [Prolixibacteraceae bacterium]